MTALTASAAVERAGRSSGPEVTDVEPGVSRCDWLRLQRFAEACGDENPLYLDPRYGAGSRWSTMLAPPAFVLAIRAPESIGQAPPEAAIRHLADLEIEWDDHLHLGDRVDSCLRIVDDPGGSPADSEAERFVNNRATYTKNGVGFAGARAVMDLRPPEAVVAAREIHRYDDEEIGRMIDELCAEPPRRGWRPRFWDEVRPGDRLPGRLRGPLTWSDLIVWVIAEGRPVKAGNLRYLEALQGDAPVALHPTTGWPYLAIEGREDFLAGGSRGASVPSARPGLIVALVCTMLTDWMGDEGFLRRLRIRLDQSVLYGDACHLAGAVRDRFDDHGHEGFGALVDFTVTNQLDEPVAAGEASVLLPRPGRPVEPPAHRMNHHGV